MQFDAIHILLFFVSILLLLGYRLSRVGKREKALPPGPPTKSVIGNLLDIPPRYAHLKFTEWSKSFGPVFSCKLLNATMVVLNDADSVMEILDKRSGSSSERPPSHINGELIANNNHVLLSTGARSTMLRKVLWNILHHPDDFYTEIRRFSASLTLAITYGKRCADFSTKDQSGFSIEDFYNLEWDFNFFLEVGAAPPVDLLPVLKYLPPFLAPWKAQALNIRKRMKDMYQYTLLAEVRQKMDKGQETGCWMEQVIKSNPELEDETKAWIGGVMMEGGSDTTSSILVTLILAAVLHPEAVRKIQKELDSVIGFDRSPNIEDMDALPYCRAFLLEVMRWRPAVPAGVPHRMSKDEIYDGMLIPAGATVVENTWAILHDPAKYDNPERFDPDRFMKHKYGLKPSLPADDRAWRNTFPYGAGRRICQGMHFAENTLKLGTAKLLWAFDFGRKIEPSSGKLFPCPDDNFRPGHITAPDYFQCTITPRNASIAKAIEEEYSESLGLLRQYETSVKLQ